MKRLKHVIILEEYHGETVDDVGGITGGTWVEIKRVYGSIRQKKGTRVLENGKIKDVSEYEVRMRFVDNLVSTFSAESELSQKYRLVFLNGTIVTIDNWVNEGYEDNTVVVTGQVTQQELEIAGRGFDDGFDGGFG